VQFGGEPDVSPDGLSARSHAAYDDSAELKAMTKANFNAERVVFENQLSRTSCASSLATSSERRHSGAPTAARHRSNQDQHKRTSAAATRCDRPGNCRPLA
jgi:hypothetical protein